jgi:hypothetical protein
MSRKPVDADESPDLLAEVRVLRQQVSQLQQEQQRQQRVQEQVQQQQQLLQALGDNFRASVAATGPVDPLRLALEDWEALSPKQRLAATRAAAKIARLELQRAFPGDPRAGSPYVVVCGREAGGSPRIVFDGTRIPSREEVRRWEQEHGCRAWRLAGPALGIAEEAGRGAARSRLERAPAPGPALHWTFGHAPSPGQEGPEDDDFYPRVRVRISPATEPHPPDAVVEFEADLDTGAQFCAFPAEGILAVPGLASVLDGVHPTEDAEHLGQIWEVFVVDPQGLRLEVCTEAGWRQFIPRNTDEAHELRFSPDWGPHHALCQVRRDRQAFVGRPIWRGAVKLTLESNGADWESAPPVTY